MQSADSQVPSWLLTRVLALFLQGMVADLVWRLLRFFVELAELAEARRRHLIPDVVGRAQLTILVSRA